MTESLALQTAVYGTALIASLRVGLNTVPSQNTDTSFSFAIFRLQVFGKRQLLTLEKGTEIRA